MGTSIKRTFSIPEDLSRYVDAMAREQGRSASAVVRDALRAAVRRRSKERYREAQAFWSAEAAGRGVLGEEDLERYLSE